MGIIHTLKYGIPYPDLDAPADVPSDMSALATLIDAKMAGFLAGVAAARPPAATVGRFYYAVDTRVVSLDNGSAWRTVNADYGFQQQTTPVSTSSAVAVDLGGPSVTVHVASNDLVAVYSFIEISVGAGQAYLFQGGVQIGPLLSYGSTPVGTQRIYSAPGVIGGTAQPIVAGEVVLAPAGAGNLTFGLRYSNLSGASPTFGRRAIWARTLPSV